MKFFKNLFVPTTWELIHTVSVQGKADCNKHKEGVLTIEKSNKGTFKLTANLDNYVFELTPRKALGMIPDLAEVYKEHGITLS